MVASSFLLRLVEVWYCYSSMLIGHINCSVVTLSKPNPPKVVMECLEAFRYSLSHPQNVKHPVVSLGVHTRCFFDVVCHCFKPVPEAQPELEHKLSMPCGEEDAHLSFCLSKLRHSVGCT